MQTLAIMPGVSRAGVVITAALIVGFNRNDSIKKYLFFTINTSYFNGINLSNNTTIRFK